MQVSGLPESVVRLSLPADQIDISSGAGGSYRVLLVFGVLEIEKLGWMSSFVGPMDRDRRSVRQYASLSGEGIELGSEQNGRFA